MYVQFHWALPESSRPEKTHQSWLSHLAPLSIPDNRIIHPFGVSAKPYLVPGVCCPANRPRRAGPFLGTSKIRSASKRRTDQLSSWQPRTRGKLLRCRRRVHPRARLPRSTTSDSALCNRRISSCYANVFVRCARYMRSGTMSVRAAAAVVFDFTILTVVHTPGTPA